MSQERTFEIVDGWLVERCEGDQIDGYGILPGSDLVPHMDLSQIKGWMFSDEAIERAAHAIWNATGHDPNAWVYMAPETHRKQRYMSYAKAAIAALKGDA